MASRLVFLCVCAALASAVAAVPTRVEEERTNEVEENWWPSKQINMVQRMLNDCSSGDPLTVCLKAKAVTFLDRVLRKDSIPLMEGLTLVADGNTSRARSGRALTEEELVASLPRELGKKETTLDEMIVSKLTDFFNGHKVKLDFAEEGSDVAEPRKKEKKLLPYILMAKLVAAGHFAMALKGLAFLATKALIIAKIALLLTGLIALKKLFSHDSHKTYEVITTDHHDSHDRASLPQDSYAQDLAYRGYQGKPQ